MAHGGLQFYQQTPKVKFASTGDLEVSCGPAYFRMAADEAEDLYRQLGELLPDSPDKPDTNKACWASSEFREAVAELIEADHEYDKVCGQPKYEIEQWASARARRSIALARIASLKGGA